MIGQSIGSYKILEKLSETETIEVYKAVDILLERSVLIKVLNRDSFNRSDIFADFRFEAATLARLDHSCIPTLHSLTETGESLFMISEFAGGERLDKVLQRRKKLSFAEAAPIFVQILDCLEYSHKSGVVHADLKVSSIVLMDRAAVKVLGYGTRKHSRRVERGEGESANREQSNKIDASGDIYAVGAMLFETLTGKSLLDFENSLEGSEKPIEEIRKFLYSVDPFVPEEIKSAVVKALFPNRTNRFQNAADFREVLLVYGFDDLKAEEEISVFEKSMINALPLPGLQPFDLIDKRVAPSDNTTVLPSETVFGNKDAAVYSASFSQNEYKIREKKSDLTEISANGLNAAPTKVAFLKNSQKRLSAGLGAAIIAILVSHFVWQFYFIQSENLQVVATPAKSEPVEKQIVESKPELKAKNQEIVKPPPPVLPNKSPQFEATPSQTVLKKKAPVETRAERLRRVEKALTGI